MSRVPLYRSSEGGLLTYRSASNMDLRDGSIKPSPRLLRVRNITNGHLGKCAPTVVRWTYNGIERPWYASYTYLIIANAGSESVFATAGAITDICAHEDGSGNARLLISYGNAAAIASMDETPTGDTTPTPDAKMGLMAAAGGALYAVCDKAVWNAAQVSMLPAGNDPVLAANWGDGLPVGPPTWAINSLRPLGGAVVVGKPEGAYVYKETASRYENLLSEYIQAPHSNNCKGMFNAANGVCIPLADGTLLHFDGFTVSDISPRRYAVHHRDNPHVRARITAGCYANGWVYVATAPWEAGWTQEFGIKVFKCVTGTPNVYTDLTDNLIDGKKSTTSSIAGLVNGDYIYIGANVPFEGVNITMGTVATTGTHNPLQYYASGGWTDIATGQRYDNTYQNLIAFAKSGFIFWRDFYTAHTSMVADSLADIATNGTATSDLYWVRIPIAATISAGTTITEIQILPSRPPISSAAALAYTGPDAAGRFSHILAGRPSGSEWVWHDLYAIPVDSEIEAMAYVQYDLGQAEQNQGTALLMVGQHSRFYAMMGNSMMPTAPVNENYADGNTVGTPVVYFLPSDLSDADTDRSTVQKIATAFDVYGEYVNSSDTLTMLARMDHNPWDTAQAVSTAPVRIKAPGGNEGLRLETALAYEDPNATELAGPRISRVDVEFQDTTSDFDAHPQGNATTPELE